MKRSTLVTAVLALLAAALWHLPSAAPKAAEAAPPESIAFDQYRDFRMRDIARRQERLARQLAVPDLTAPERTSLQARKAYYDRLATMPQAERDRLFHTRFDQIDANHDGALDQDERAAWRAKQAQHYRRPAAQHADAGADPP